MGLSVYAYRLYGRIKRRAGDDGVCDEGTKSLAAGCGMSMGAVSKAKKELEKRGLVVVRPGDQKKSESDRIRVVDVWAENFARFVPEERAKTDLRLVEAPPDPPSPHEHPPFTERNPPSPHETKKELRSVVEERPPDGGPKKPAASSPPREKKEKRARVAKLDDDEARRMFDELCETDPNGDSLRDLAALLAAENDGGKVAMTRVWRVIGDRYARARKRESFSEEAWAYGFDEAVSREKPNIGYVLSCARGYRPPRSKPGGRSRGGGNSIAVVGASDEDYNVEDYR